MRLRLRLFTRFRWRVRPGAGRRAGSRATARGEASPPAGPAAGRHRRADRPREAAAVAATPGPQTAAEAPFPSPVQEARPRPSRPSRGGAGPARGGGRGAGAGAGGRGARGAGEAERGGGSSSSGVARVAVRTAPGTAAQARQAPAREAARQSGKVASEAALPWYEVAHARRVAGGQRNCGALEKVLCRDWDSATLPPPEVVRAIDRLAELPASVSHRLAEGLDAIYVGPGGVPDLDDMGRLRGVPLPSGRATWDACAGAYGEHKIIIGTRPSATPDVVCHEVGHALDDLDGAGGMWQSDSDEFRALYGRCLPRLVSDFHRQEGSLGRRELFADAFAAIASGQRPALVDMLGGDTRIALDVMLYFNMRYGI